MKTQQTSFNGFGVAAVGGVVCAGVLYAGFGRLDADALRATAAMLTLALPVAFAAGFAVARLQVGGFMAGISTGLESVMQAADIRETVRERQRAGDVKTAQRLTEIAADTQISRRALTADTIEL